MIQSRREFLQTSLSGLAYFSAASTVPLWLSKSAQAACTAGIPDDRILVIYQQAGGNDGLNTVIPYTDPKYYLPEIDGGLRQNLRIDSGLQLGDGLNALHPKLSLLKSWYDSGNVAIVQNVGYPNQSLSHFTGTDLWELGISPSSSLSTSQGWISRFFDNQCSGAPPSNIEPLAMIANGLVKLPLTLSGSINYFPPAVSSFDSYTIDAATPAVLGDHINTYIDSLNNLTVTVNSDLDFIQRTSNITQASVDDMAIASLIPLINQYPGNGANTLPIPSNTMGPGLEMVSKIVRADQFNTKVFFVQQGGYDTHANQFGLDGGTPDPANLGDHARLLEEADASLNAFLSDMQASGHLDRIVLMSFSEFGRRPQENGSRGTDHGTANSLFVMGGEGVIGGVYGGQPDLENLMPGNQGGNLQHQVDFRAVYSVVLRDWLGVDPEVIFGATDFNDPSFNIAGGMDDILFINENAGVDLNEAWVDKNYFGVETGSYSRPFQALSGGVNKVVNGGTVKLKTGSTIIDTPQTISKNVRIESE
ncbi:MAG: DUF1501 domain-containing protein [Candidatus Hydrogenedentota bacterium]